MYTYTLYCDHPVARALRDNIRHLTCPQDNCPYGQCPRSTYVQTHTHTSH